MTRRVVLIGFMGAGKSTVGSLLAKAIGWRFVDLDEEVARHTGQNVPAIIRRRGLAAFRRIESRVGREVLRLQRAVIAVGGGWPAEPGHMNLLGADTLSVWLKVRPATAVRRVAEASETRPLLETADPHAKARALVRQRLPHYRRADFAVDTEGRSPDAVAARIMEHLRPQRTSEGGEAAT